MHITKKTQTHCCLKEGQKSFWLLSFAKLVYFPAESLGQWSMGCFDKTGIACKAISAGLRTLIILLLRYDVYDDIVDLSQTFLVVEEVRQTVWVLHFCRYIFLKPSLCYIFRFHPEFKHRVQEHQVLSKHSLKWIICWLILVLQAEDCDHYAYIYTPLACPFAAQNWTKFHDCSVAQN